MSKLTIIADMTAKVECIEEFKAELLKLIPPTQNDEGFITYDLHQDNVNPEHFLFYEVWENRELWQVHCKQPHLAAFSAATKELIASSKIYEMTKLN